MSGSYHLSLVSEIEDLFKAHLSAPSFSLQRMNLLFSFSHHVTESQSTKHFPVKCKILDFKSKDAFT